MELSVQGVKPAVVCSESHLNIRGTRLRIDELVDEQQLAPENAVRLHESMSQAQPFGHVVLKGLFNDRLLELINDEFELNKDRPWKQQVTKYEDTRRSMPGSRLGPAAQLYFWVVNSAPVIRFLNIVSGGQDLIPDPMLIGGGMHETHNGGHFAIHRDFEYHKTNSLTNRMVFITYLNRDWSPSYGGALELWDNRRKQCVTMVSPDFGVSVIMPHGPKSYHGYSKPLSLPPGRSRRSVASYYYTNDGLPRQTYKYSKFLYKRKADIAKDAIKQFIPPIVWSGLTKLKR